MNPYLQDPDLTLYQGDALEVLRTLPDESVQMCVTSPPFYGLRDYGVEGQIGLEPTPEEWCAKLVEVFREVRRVLRSDGTLWLEVGDSYANTPVGSFNGGGFKDKSAQTGGRDLSGHKTSGKMDKLKASGLKQKDLIGAPWLLAFALRADGWYLRSDIVWSRPNPMPESVTDRPTKSHSYIFMLSKASRYFFDQEAVREPHNHDGRTVTQVVGQDGSLQHRDGERWPNSGRNLRSVWDIATQPYAEAHFATFPEELVRRCILAGTSEKGCCPECGAPWVREVETKRRYVVSEGGSHADGTYRVKYSDEPHDVNFVQRRGDGDGFSMNKQRWHNEATTVGWEPSCACHQDRPMGVERADAPVPCVVLDPFGGSGTSALVARKHGRRSVLIELSSDYCELAAKRLSQLSLLAEGAA